MGLLDKKKSPPAWVDVIAVNGFGASHCFVHDGEEYALFRLEDGIYCTANSCTHEYSPLCEGEVMDGEVFCPKHGSCFDIRSGQVRSLPATDNVRTFPVEQRDGRVWVLV